MTIRLGILQELRFVFNEYDAARCKLEKRMTARTDFWLEETTARLLVGRTRQDFRLARGYAAPRTRGRSLEHNLLFTPRARHWR